LIPFLAAFVLIQLAASPSPAAPFPPSATIALTRDFPSLVDLELLLPQCPELRALKVELQKAELRRSLWNNVAVHANYSQHFSSFVPFVPTPELAFSGGSFVGISFSVKLQRLRGKALPEDLDARLLTIEFEKTFQQKLMALRVLHGRRQKLLSQLEPLRAQFHTARLQLQKVELGLTLQERSHAVASALVQSAVEAPLPFAFDPIDLAEAQEKVARIENEQRQTLLDITNVETEIWGLLGRGRVQP
jgi:hypothetical protein